MLLPSIIVYMVATIAIGLFAASRVKDSKDYMVAGRSLPFYMNFACVFATWFGAETVLSVSAKFADEGMGAVSGDPFGASMSLIVVAVFFTGTFYRLGLLTIGDYYHVRYGKFVEVVTSFAIACSYFGWTSAQLSALGLVINVLFPSISLGTSILIGSVIVTIYTLFGGMWSIALTDVIQTAAIVIGLIIVAVIIGNQAGGIGHVVEKAHLAGKLNLFPHTSLTAWMIFIGEFVTMSLGSIPQQDVFQRVTSARDERTAFYGTLAGGVFYFFFAFVPMFIAYSALLLDHDLAASFHDGDPRIFQQILPKLILNKTPIWVQILFFGAVLSAILSTASGTLLAPSSILTENVLQPFTKHFSDTQLIWLIRGVLICVSIISTTFAINTKSTMYELVESGYSVTLVVALVPLVFGVYWSRAKTQGAVFSIILGMIAWIGADHYINSKVKFVEEVESNQTFKNEEIRNLTFVDRKGQDVRLGDKIGEKHIVLIVLRGKNSSDCPYCTTQTAHLVKHYSRFTERNAEVMAVYPVEDPAETKGVDDFLKKVELQPGESVTPGSVPFPILVDVGRKVSKALKIEADRPAAYVIDLEGNVHFGYVGKSEGDRPSVVAILKELDKHIVPKPGVVHSLPEEAEDLWRAVPAKFYGLIGSLIGMIVGSFLPNWIKHRTASPEDLANRRQPAIGH